jgi:hypothetical protein
MRNSEDRGTESICHEAKAVPLPKDLFAPLVSKRECESSNRRTTNSAVYGEKAEKGNEIMQLKETIATLEERMKSMKSENAEKFQDICGMLLSQKLQIQRLQEITWILHPNINLEKAFTVDDKAPYFLPRSDTSIVGTKVGSD